MAKTIYLVRHAQAEHNVAEDWSIADAPLTALGRQQARDLNETTANGLQKEVQLVVTSPLRRTMATTLDGFPEAIERLGGRSKIILLPEAQECNDYPCDTGSSQAELEQDPEFEGLDMSPLSDDWTSKAGKWAATTKALSARARYVRRWLRERPEECIALVAHGDINRNILYGDRTFVPWANTEVKKLTFKDPSGQDEEALLEEIKTEAKEGGDEPTSSETL